MGLFFARDQDEEKETWLDKTESQKSKRPAKK